MDRPASHRTRSAAILGVALLLVAAALVCALAAAPVVSAYPDYVHGGISPVACEICHTDNHTNWPVASEKCLTCHTGYDAPDLPVTCWTCHTPGQDMAAARSDAACTTGCHLPDGTTKVHAAHADGGEVCTTCHPVSPSIDEAGGDPHHVLPVPTAPAVTGFSPSAGAPGTAVTVTGAHLSKAIAVTFGGVRSSTFRVLSDTRLSAVVPFGAATGPVAVLNAGGTGTSTADFVVPGRVRARLAVAAAPRTLARGGRVTVRGSVAPAALAHTTVAVRFERRSGPGWVSAHVVFVTTTPAAAFRCAWRPPRSGLYRVRATLAATAGHTAARSGWASFRVR